MMLATQCFVLLCLLTVGYGKRLRIVNGFDALPGEIPFQVSLQSTANLGHFCGASIINKNFVLTAAHCTRTDKIILKPEQIQVATGIRNDRPVSVHRVTQIYIHPDYNVNKSYTNDIGILKVTPPFKFNDLVAPATLPEPHQIIPNGQKVIVSGFGTITFPNLTMTKILKKAPTVVVNLENCNRIYESTSTHIYPTQLCTHDLISKRASCSGDSGGPLTIDNKILVGIVSWSRKDPSCGNSKYPNVFTRVSEYIDWIKSAISILQYPLVSEEDEKETPFTFSPM